MPCRRPSGSWILPEDGFAVRAILPHPEGRGFLFLNMDKMVGADFETGLANLKALAEKSPS
jgi:hypothetical protein